MSHSTKCDTNSKVPVLCPMSMLNQIVGFGMRYGINKEKNTKLGEGLR